MNITKGKINIMMGGQFGSEGKGVFASYISATNHIDISLTNSSPNAGHTFYYNGRKYVVKHLPVSAVINKRSTIYLTAGSIINPEILLDEINTCNIDKSRIVIHPRCAIISNSDIDRERELTSSFSGLASTQSGVGSALMRKIERSSSLAENCESLKEFIKHIDLSHYLDLGCTALIEVPQGLGLGINSGLSYPYCTSREISVGQALSDAQLHPYYLGKVLVCLRTHPIRVGNLKVDNIEIGFSGPFYSDSREITWDELNLKPEYTTNTKRVRRVSSFSFIQYDDMLKLFRPNIVFLNFCNYLSKIELKYLLKKLPEVTHLGFGRTLDDIMES